MLLPATYDSATKLLKLTGQDFVAAVTYGVGAIGGAEPRTAHSFIPEFEAELAQANAGRLSVQAFAQQLGAFYGRQYAALMDTNAGQNVKVSALWDGSLISNTHGHRSSVKPWNGYVCCTQQW